MEKEREIPIIHDVDVVVVGGSSGAVAAARKAAKSGAKVFLLAPRPYLGEDIAGTLRLWSDGNGQPNAELAKLIYGIRNPVLPFTYKASIAPEPENPDPDNRKLNDGIWNDIDRHGVQYKGKELEILIDMGREMALNKLLLYAYESSRKPGSSVSSAVVSTSTDGQSWSEAGKSTSWPKLNPPNKADYPGTFVYEFPLNGKARYIKLVSTPHAAVMRQWLGEIVIESAGLAAAVPNGAMAVTTPLNVKKTLDDALLEAGVPFLTGAYGTEVLTDEKGNVAGVVVSNRSGRQAVRAKVVIDATDRAFLARQAGAKFRPFPPGAYTFSQTVVSGEVPKAPGMEVREFANEYDTKLTGMKAPAGMPEDIKGRLFECSVSLPMKGASFSSFAEAEQTIRDLTFTSQQLDTAEKTFFIPPDSLIGTASMAGAWKDAAAIDLNVCRPAGVPYFYALSAMADVPREAAVSLVKPCNLMELAERVGVAAAAEAKKRGEPVNVRIRRTGSEAGVVKGEVREILEGLMPNSITATGKVVAELRGLPVLAECDVLVVGGGTSGAPAAISAARQGMKTILLEYQYNLGGVSTVGILGSYYYGNPCGFTEEIDEGVSKTGAVFVQSKAEWYRRQCRISKAEIWFGAMASGAVLDGDKVVGAVVLAPDGTRGVIRAKTIIDSTGNADIAAAAGSETEFINPDELSLQGATMNWRNLGSSCINVDISFVDDEDAADMCFFALRGRKAFPYNMYWDQSQLVNSRERRHMVGEYVVQPMDFMNGRTFPDTIVQCYTTHDTHGQTNHDMLFLSMISSPESHIWANLPYRALLPKKLDGLIVTGLGISAHRDAIPVLRMQRDVQNQGYAAGYAAAMGIKDNVPPRDIDIKKLQKHLVEIKVLKPEVLAYVDNYPLSDDSLKQAVKEIPRYGGYNLLWRLFTDPKRSVPMLVDAYNKTNDSDAVSKTRYAAVLAMMGDRTGTGTLIKTIESSSWDTGWDWKGMGAFGRKTSYIDGYMIALGKLRAGEALPAILKKAEQLEPKDGYSHFRAVSLACEAIGDKSAAPVLAALLGKPGIGGYALSMDGKFPDYKGFSCPAGDKERNLSLREICLARALYNLGDHEGKGEAVLVKYSKDPRGAYAKHALMVMQKKQAEVKK